MTRKDRVLSNCERCSGDSQSLRRVVPRVHAVSSVKRRSRLATRAAAFRRKISSVSTTGLLAADQARVKKRFFCFGIKGTRDLSRSLHVTYSCCVSSAHQRVETLFGFEQCVRVILVEEVS